MLYGFNTSGGFYVIDHKLRRAAYAYPTSTLAVNAKRKPRAVADVLASDFGQKLSSEPLNSSGVSQASIAEEHYAKVCKSNGIEIPA